MKYSVIIPAYNASATINRCIDSILTQPYTDYEIIIIDDGSKDDTWSILQKFVAGNGQPESRIRIFHKPNGGVSSARNLGLDNAQGEWITFVDADDYLEQDYFPVSLNNTYELAINSWKYSDVNEIQEPIESQILISKNQVRQFLAEHLHKDILRCPWAKFYRKDIIKSHQIHFNESYKIGEDTLFVLDYLQYISKIFVSDNGVYRYTRIQNTESKYKQDVDISLSYLGCFYRAYKQLGVENQQLLKLLFNYYYGISNNIEEQSNNQKWFSNSIVISILYELYYSKGIINYICYIKLLLKSIIYRYKIMKS